MTGEAALHQQFEAYLRKQGIPWSHDRMDKRTSANDSGPDFRCYLNGQVAFVEFKVGRNKLSPAQKERIEELETAGCAVCVAYDLQTAVSHVEAQLMPGAATGHPASPEGATFEEWERRGFPSPTFPKGGDASCPTKNNTSLGCSGAGQSNPAPAPKLWLAKSRDLGMVVVSRNPVNGSMGYVRLAKPDDMTLPTWTGALL